jgi:hypothetical protein
VTTPARTRGLAIALGTVAFIVLATANSGGYRYGASDQAFYAPAIALGADPTLFPRDRELLAPQMRLWLGDSLIGGLAATTGLDLPILFAVLYVFTLVMLFAAAVGLARGLGADWWTTAAFLTLLTLRHQITRTGANSLEGYLHPRMLAFAFGIAAFAAIVTRRPASAVVWAAVAALVHTTTGLWFAAAVFIARLWDLSRRSAVYVGLVSAIAAAAGLALTGDLASRLVVMDADWIAALGDRAYLFSDEWPVSAWVVNLAYPVFLVAVYRRRRSAGVSVSGEAGLVAGLVGLVVLFIVSLPAVDQRVALAVQLQINRVFWLLDAVVMFSLAWWLMSGAGGRLSLRIRTTIVAALVLASTGRGAYLITVAPGRPLAEVQLSASAWTDAMAWLRTQPTAWHVLADPQHAWRYGSSVRVAARRDTLFEAGKDPALAIYDRASARRVTERSEVLAAFDTFATSDVRALASRYALDVFVDRADRTFDFPVLYRNDEFIIYDLR